MSEETVTVQKFWRNLRKGEKAKQNFAGKTPHRVQMDNALTPDKLAAHRAMLEHDLLWKNALEAIREAAKEFDEWTADEKAKKRAKRGRGDRITVPKRKRVA